MKNSIGFSVGSLLRTKEIIDFASKIEQNESVNSLWVPETWGREAFSILGAMTNVTHRVNLGTSIINIYSRSPATIAMGAITINNLSSNRMIIGLGVSTQKIIENLHGIVYRDHLTRMIEYIESIKKLFKPEKISYNGKIIKIQNFKLLEETQTEIPIHIAAVNEKMIDVGIKYAAGIIHYLKPFEELKKVVASIKNRSNNIHNSLVIITSVSNKEPHKAKLRAMKTLAFYISVGNIYYNFLLKTKFRTEIEKIYKDYHNHSLQVAMENISEILLDEMVIHGSVNDCISQIQKIKKSGIDLPILQINPVENENGQSDYKGFYEL
jgi:5,10-methylenetetrahydromethanopterin reductase